MIQTLPYVYRAIISFNVFESHLAHQIIGVGRSGEGKWESKVGSESERINRQIGIELLGGTDPVVVTDPDPNRFGFG